MTPRDKAIIRYLKSRQGIIGISLGLTVAGIVFIILTGRYELSWFVAAPYCLGSSIGFDATKNDPARNKPAI